jgi:hypothetical protein
LPELNFLIGAAVTRGLVSLSSLVNNLAGAGQEGVF